MKRIKVLLILILVFILQGCGLSDPKYINLKSKPDNSYYTKEIHKKILNGEDYSFTIFNTDLYKTLDVSVEEKGVLDNFITSLSTENYNEDLDLPDKEPYQIKVTFSDSNKYLIKVYGNTKVTISPWDGVFKEDLITMDDVPSRYNLYDFCKHIDMTD